MTNTDKILATVGLFVVGWFVARALSKKPTPAAPSHAPEAANLVSGAGGTVPIIPAPDPIATIIAPTMP